MTRLAALRRNIAFARHIPPRQMVARLRLWGQRRWAVKMRPQLIGLRHGELAVADQLPPPISISPPRTGRIMRLENGWRFTFLNRAIDMGDRVDWSAPGPGPANQLWRMNLNYMEYLAEVSEGDALNLIGQWIAANPPYQAGYWHAHWNAYALSIRTVIWMEQIARWGWDHCDPIYAPVFESLAAQIHFLQGNLERDIGGNHLIKNIRALAHAGRFFTGPRAAHWRALAVKLLREQIPVQILADGMHYERSPSYHAQVFADLIACSRLMGDDAPASLAPAIDRMARATALMAHPDGTPALFNDAGLNMAATPAQYLAAYHAHMKGKVPAPQGGFALPTAGYFGLHNGLITLIADLGLIGPDALPGHGHGDIGSFELSVAGLRIIVDQGVFEYIPGTRRDQSRSAHHHNVLAIEGTEPAEFFGAFRCGRRPDAYLEAAEVHPQSMTAAARHNGYSHLPGRPVVRQQFEATADCIRIIDQIDSQKWHAATWRLLLHPACAVTLNDQGAVITRGNDRLSVHTHHPIAIEPAHWWPDMGHEVPTQRLCIQLPPQVFTLETTLHAAVHTHVEAQ